MKRRAGSPPSSSTWLDRKLKAAMHSWRSLSSRSGAMKRWLPIVNGVGSGCLSRSAGRFRSAIG
eukprot:1577660-Pyramimonas_sp.AAC.1